MKPIVIDIFVHNQINDWAEARKAGVEGVIHKATEGGGWKDKSYHLRRGIAAHHGFLYGAYHFANNTPVKAQVDNFLSQVRVDGQIDDKLLLALDWEDPPANTSYKRMSTEGAKEWLLRVCDATKRSPSGVWVYTGHVGKEMIKSVKDAEFFAQFPLWLCHYGVRTPVDPWAWKTVGGHTLWQYSDQSALLGRDGKSISGTKIDFNVLHPRIKDLRSVWAPGTKSSVPSEPAPAPAQPDVKVTEPAPTPKPAPVLSAWDRLKGWFR